MDPSAQILYVEDDPIDVENLRRALTHCGGLNPVRAVANGAEALTLLRGAGSEAPLRPGIILLDLGMPVMGGLEFLMRLRSEPELRSIPVVVLSASRHDRDVREAYEFGVAGYLVKPVDFAGFAQVVAALTRYWLLCEVPLARTRWDPRS